MKKNILIVLIFSFLFSADKSESYKIEGMHCSYGCVNKVKSIMNSLDGVKTCDVSFEKSLMTVKYDDSKINMDKIISSLTEGTTYNTTIINENDK